MTLAVGAVTRTEANTQDAIDLIADEDVRKGVQGYYQALLTHHQWRLDNPDKVMHLAQPNSCLSALHDEMAKKPIASAKQRIPLAAYSDPFVRAAMATITTEMGGKVDDLLAALRAN